MACLNPCNSKRWPKGIVEWTGNIRGLGYSLVGLRLCPDNADYRVRLLWVYILSTTEESARTTLPIGLPCTRFAMKCFMALGILLVLTNTSLADAIANRLRIENGKIVVAQSYCRMCADSRTSCQLGCNGAGTCIQACDDQYRDCTRQNCRR